MTRLVGLLLGLTLSGTLSARIGEPCKSSHDCGTREECVIDFKEGYCASFDCSAKNACAGDSKCMSLEPENITLCLKACTKNSDCRTGYRCYEQGVCLP